MKRWFIIGIIFLLPLAKAEAAEYVVKRGDYLSKIAKDWKKVARINKIKEPYLIYPGQKLKIPNQVNKSKLKIYLVKQGDYLSKIAKDWKKVARINKIQPPYIIYPGQKLILPGNKQRIKEWLLYRNIGANPYQGTWQWALDNFDLSEQIKQKIRQNIQQDKFNWFQLSNGQKIEEMVSGKDKILEKRICQWDKTKLYAAKDYGCANYHYIYILKCGNWAWLKKEKEKQELQSVMKDEPLKKAELPKPLEKTEAPEFPPVSVSQAKRTSPTKENFDLYIGGGIYESAHYDALGSYAWTKLRYRPFEFTSKDEQFKTRLGFHVFGSFWAGDDQGYDYQGSKIAFGPSAQLIGKHWDTDFDLGIGWMWNEGSVNLYKSRQKDDIFLLSTHGNFYSRRDQGEKWFPETEINLELTLPYHTEQKHSWDGNPLPPDEHDNRTLELMFNQAIYDFTFNDQTRLTPGFNLGLIREFGQDEPNFIQFGPNLTLAWHNQEIVQISAFNYKENLGGNGDQVQWLSGWLSIDGLVAAYQASQITQLPED